MLEKRTLIVLCVAAVLASGCKPEQDEAAAPEGDAGSEAVAPAASEPAPVAAAPVQTQAAPAKAFDIGGVAVSDKPLGEWPYLAAPAGYVFSEDTADGTKDLARVPFWTGGQLVWVEGKTYETRINAGEGKTFSRFEVLKGVDQALTALGAVKLTDQPMDQATHDASKAEIASFVSEFTNVYDAYEPGSSGRPTTYVIRRPDKAVWAVITSNNSSAGLLLADGPLPEPASVQ